ncbi:MAG: hypothetical protein GQE15_04060 [Archangiaceae bacterium]|nr:hypothetical protein [Archangiaceae bacterium]
MDHAKTYDALLAEQRNAWQQTQASPFGPRHAQAHSFAIDLDSWLRFIHPAPEAVVLQKAAVELHASLSLVAVAHYRAAFFSLRSFLELGLLTIQHSLHYLHHRQWLIETRDVSWSEMVDEASGIFASNTVKAFAAEFSPDAPEAGTIARLAYRRASTFVHGNTSSDAYLTTPFKFSEDALELWFKTMDDARYVVSFALAMRYLPLASRACIGSIEQMLSDELGDVRGVQSALERKP